MLKKRQIIYFPVMALAALLLSACNLSSATSTPTEAVDAVYTMAAETMTARAAEASSTPYPSATKAATKTPTATITLIPATTAPPTTNAANFCDNSVYVSDVTIPDNTVMAPGQTFDKTWALQNTGTCTWTTGYTIIFSNGDLMGGNTRPLTVTVAPGAQGNVTVPLIAPNTPGTYTGWWRLVNGKGAPFGQPVSVVIKVEAGTTSTVTVTPTPGGNTATPSATSTATTTQAEINVVTDTPTPTATATSTGT